MARVQETLSRSGRVPELPMWEPDVSTWRRDSPLYDYIRRDLMPRAIDGDRVLRMLIGSDPTQRWNLVLTVNTIRRIRHELPALKKRAAEIRRLRQRYMSLWRARLHEDPLLPSTLREVLRQHLEVILVAINLLGPRSIKDRPVPRMGISVRPGKQDSLPRQRFWTEPMVALVDYLAGPLGGNNPAYRATARLLHLAFGFPDQWRLVERRVLHHRKKAPSAPSRPPYRKVPHP